MHHSGREISRQPSPTKPKQQMLSTVYYLTIENDIEKRRLVDMVVEMCSSLPLTIASFSSIKEVRLQPGKCVLELAGPR